MIGIMIDIGRTAWLNSKKQKFSATVEARLSGFPRSTVSPPMKFSFIVTSRAEASSYRRSLGAGRNSLPPSRQIRSRRTFSQIANKVSKLSVKNCDASLHAGYKYRELFPEK